MMAPARQWAEMKAPDFRDVPPDAVAVLPMGAVEQHGPHLPLCVDYQLIEAVLDRAMPLVDPSVRVLVLPTLRVTKSDEHIRHAGTLSLSADTLLAVLRDLGASVARAGVTRLVLFNGHGGNSALLQVVARDLRLRHGMKVVACSWSDFAEAEGLFDPDDWARDLHAGASETSVMLAARPDLVDMSAAPAPDSVIPSWQSTYRFVGLTGKAVRPGWIIDDLARSGVVGDARDADASRGAALLDGSARNFAAFLKEFSAFGFRGQEG